MTTDEQAIRRIVQQMETVWNASDSIGFANGFAADADFVDVLGRHHVGRANIEAGHRQIFDTVYRGSKNHHAVESIKFVRPEVAIVFVCATLVSRLGNRVDDPQRTDFSAQNQTMSEARARQTLVLAKAGERWEIVAFQNTKVAAGTVSEIGK